MAADDGSLTRRKLVERGVIALAGTGLAGSLPVLRYLSPESVAAAAGPAEIAEDAVGLWQASRLLIGGRPGFVVRTPAGIHAVSGVCTHLGCVVRWQSSRRQFFCPCHGGRFSAEGNVLGGPPPRALDTYGVTVAEGKILVHTA
jgi:cytochrome b6-f complex iron-sulfur subunit